MMTLGLDNIIASTKPAFDLLQQFSYISTRCGIHGTTLFRQTVQTKSVSFNNTKEMGVKVTDGKLSICHCAEPFD